MSNENTDYCWLRIRIFGRKDEASSYPVEAELDDGSWYAGFLKYGAEEAAQLLEKQDAVRDYGIGLGALLFSEGIATAYDIVAGRARERCGGRLRVQLWISPECSDLQAVPWERLFVKFNGQQVALASDDLMAFSRFTRLSQAEPGVIKERPLRLLFAIANPLGLPDGFSAINVEAEIEGLVAALDGVPDLRVTLLSGRTPLSDTLRARLPNDIELLTEATTPELLQRQLANHHIMHFLGHGKFRRDKVHGPLSELFLEDQDGHVLLASDREIVNRLVTFHAAPRLIFLASCETARRYDTDPRPFVGLGPKLVEAGFPAVVAMQAQVPMELAHKLTRDFYRNLLRHGLIDRALNEARNFLQTEKHSDWAIPVLFMRTPGGRLFAANPVREALRATAAARPFQPRWRYTDLPLQAVMLTDEQIKPGWEIVARKTQARVDLWKQTLDLLQTNPTSDLLPTKGQQRFLLAIAGERGTARSTHLRRLVRHIATQSIAQPDKPQVLPIYVDLALRLKQSPGKMDFLALLTESLNDYWPDELDTDGMQSLLNFDDGNTALLIVFDNFEDLPEAQRTQLIEELLPNLATYYYHQFVITFGHVQAGVERLPITHLLDTQALSRRKIEKFLRHEIFTDLNAQANAQATTLEKLEAELAALKTDALRAEADKAKDQAAPQPDTVPAPDAVPAPDEAQPETALELALPQQTNAGHQAEQRRDAQFVLEQLIEGQQKALQETATEISEADKLGEKLAKALEETQLYDLAAQPWLLVRMIEQSAAKIAAANVVGQQEQLTLLTSRVTVLQEVVADKIARIPRAGGLQARALDTLHALAREMQFSYRSTLPLQDAIPILVAVRGGREYKLDEMLAQLTESDLLAMSGTESVRFLYSGLQAFCCAQALVKALPRDESQVNWSTITAGLGRINQVRWWAETLILLCGMLQRPDALIEQIVYGESFAESERVFLAARCLMEADRARNERRARGDGATGALADEVRDALLWLLAQQRSVDTRRIAQRRNVARTLQSLLLTYRAATSQAIPAKAENPTYPDQDDAASSKGEEKIEEIMEPLVKAFYHLVERSQAAGSTSVADRVIEALIWRSSSLNEPRSYQRLRAVEELGRQRRPEVVPFLARVATKPTRVAWTKDRSFEYGGIRQAAGRALRRMMPAMERELDSSPALGRLVKLWAEACDPTATAAQVAEKVALLREMLAVKPATAKQEDAHALSSMAAFALGDIDSEETRQILYDMFQHPATELGTRWDIADTLAVLDPDEVMEKVISPLLPSRADYDQAGFQIPLEPFEEAYETLAYLIGQLRNADDRALLFLTQSLTRPMAAALRNPQNDYVLKGRAILALGLLNQQACKEKFERIALGDFTELNLFKPGQRNVNDKLRIKALQALAEIGDLDTLTQLRYKGDSHKTWPSEVERVFYVTSEEINWRLNADG